MSTLFISLLTLVLLLISGFVILLVLMQRTSQSGGMGAALGGGAAESAFGSETNNVLTKATIYSIVAFFLVALGLFLIYQSKAADRMQTLNPEALIRSSESDTVEMGTYELDLPEAPVTVPETLEDSDVPTIEVEAPVEEAVPVLE